MNTAAETDRTSRCPVCSGAELRSETRTETFDYDGDGDKVQVTVDKVPVEVCPACGEVFSGPEAGRIRNEAICKALGYLTPQEIRRVRERLNLTQAGFAQLTGIGEATISRWERGRLIQNRAMNQYLSLLAYDPGIEVTLLRIKFLQKAGGSLFVDADNSQSGNQVADVLQQ